MTNRVEAIRLLDRLLLTYERKIQRLQKQLKEEREMNEKIRDQVTQEIKYIREQLNVKRKKK